MANWTARAYASEDLARRMATSTRTRYRAHTLDAKLAFDTTSRSASRSAARSASRSHQYSPRSHQYSHSQERRRSISELFPAKDHLDRRPVAARPSALEPSLTQLHENS